MKFNFALKTLFSLILLLMLIVTVWASLQDNVLVGGAQVLREPWGLATCADAYCGFLTFYAWVFYKESEAWKRLLWLILILVLGNIAMSSYVLIQLFRLPKGAKIETLLLRRQRL